MGRGRKKINLIGKRFGKLVVVEQFYNKGNRFVKCKCDCGGEITIAYNNLSTTSSCRDCRPKKIKLTVGKRLNDYEIGEDIVKIKCTNGIAIVDLEDWDRLKNTYWNDVSHIRNKRIYGWHNGATTFLCRAILGDLCKGYKIIYKDGDIYNNRKSNFILVENKVFYSKSLQLSGDLDNK